SLLAVVGENFEDRRGLGRDGPEGTHRPGLHPAGAVGVLHGAVAHPLPGFRDGRLERVADAGLDHAQRAEREPDAAELPEQVRRLAPAQVVDARDERDERHQTGSEGGRRDLGRVVGRPRPVSAARAPDLMTAPFLRVRPHRWHLRLLEALRAGVGDLRELARTALAMGRIQVDDLVDLTRREEGAVRTTMSWLASSFALARLALPLALPAARARPIGRRRQVRIARV